MMKSIKDSNGGALIMSLMVLLVLLSEYTYAKPAPVSISRHKRTSDQRLAELQSLMALSKMRGKLVTVPVGFGRVDPAKIGRRRRSSIDVDLQKLRNFLQTLENHSDSRSGEINPEMIFSSSLQNEDELGSELIQL